MKRRRQKQVEVDVLDLFAGAGGTSTGCVQACEELGYKINLLAINHWNVAVATHTKNHPDAKHLCTGVDQVNPHDLVRDGLLKPNLRLLVASPECIYFSTARGGKPINDQNRATAWCIFRYLDATDTDGILIENVPAFQAWGPLIKKKVEREIKIEYPYAFDKWYENTKRLGGTKAEWRKIYGHFTRSEKWTGKEKRKVKITVEVPDPKRKGEIYIAFLNALKAYGYEVEARVLNCADYGDPTSRERLFIQARKRGKITRPEPTHAPADVARQKQPLLHSRSFQPHRPAREIIDSTIPGESIFTRKKPLSPNTIARIMAGLQKYSGLPFIVPKEGNGSTRDIERPLQVITADSRGIGYVQPFIIPNFGERDGQSPRTHSLDRPLPVITSRGAGNLVCPYIVLFRNNQSAQSLEKPLTTICTNGAHHGLCEAFLIGVGGPQGASSPRGVSEPMRTILARDHQALIESFVIGQQSGAVARSVKQPLPTIASQGAISFVQPLIVKLAHMSGNNGDQGRYVYPVDRPLTTVTGQSEHALLQSYIVPNNHGRGDTRTHDVDEPMPTITGVDAWSLAQPVLIKYHGNHKGKADGNGRSQSLDEPLSTLDTSNRFAIVWPQIHPFIVKYNGTGGAYPVDEPLDTISTRDRYGYVEAKAECADGQKLQCQCEETIIGEVVGYVDILFRMLQPHELSAAMSFPKSYFFVGNREEKVKQIGNAVPVSTAKALCKAILQS